MQTGLWCRFRSLYIAAIRETDIRHNFAGTASAPGGSWTTLSGKYMKTRYLLYVAAAISAVACAKSDTSRADSALSVNPTMAPPLDSMSAAEQAKNSAMPTNTLASPPATVSTPVHRSTSSTHSSGSSTSGTSGTTSGTTTATSSNAGTHIEKNTKRDAAIGAAAGAAIGAVTGGGVKGAVVGGAAGAILGGVIGNNVDKKRKKN